MALVRQPETYPHFTSLLELGRAWHCTSASRDTRSSIGTCFVSVMRCTYFVLNSVYSGVDFSLSFQCSLLSEHTRKVRCIVTSQ